MKRNEISTVVLYTNEETNLVVAENKATQTIEFNDGDNIFIVPSNNMTKLATLIPGEEEQIYYLTYLVNKSLSDYNYSNEGYIHTINEKYGDVTLKLKVEDDISITTGEDDISITTDEDDTSITADNCISADKFNLIFEKTLEIIPERINEIVSLFETLKDYEIEKLLNSDNIDKIVANIVYYITNYTTIEIEDEEIDLDGNYFKSKIKKF